MRQIHHVEHEQWLGGLLHANDELVHALMTYEQMDQSIDADSDSDDELAEQAHLYRSTYTIKICCSSSQQDAISGASTEIRGRKKLCKNSSMLTFTLSTVVTSCKDEHGPGNIDTPPPQPPRPAPPQLESDSEEDNSEDDADENDPFADRNMVHTPAVEQGEPRW